MATIEGQAKLLAQSIFNIAGGDNGTDIFMATVSRYDASTRDLYVFLDGNGGEVKAIPIGEKYEVGRRVMCSVNNFGNLFAIGQDDKQVQQLMRRAWFDVTEVEAGDSLQCKTEILQKDAVIAYEWISSMYPDRKRSGVAYSTTDSDIGDVLFCRVYDASGKYSGFLTTGTCVVVKNYDPTEDYDFGREIKSGTVGSNTRGASVTLRQMGETTSAKCELDFWKGLPASSTNREPIFASDVLCIGANQVGAVGIYIRDDNSYHIGPSEAFGVEGTNWRYRQIGGWNQRFRLVLDGSNVYLDGNLIISDAKNVGWGSFVPKWFGNNLHDGGWTSGSIFPHKFYADGNLVMDLAPVKIKGTGNAMGDGEWLCVEGDAGLFDLLNNAYYPCEKRMVFQELS